jgi:hypothetical protein
MIITPEQFEQYRQHLQATKNNGWHLLEVPEEMWTHEMVEAAIVDSPQVIKSVHDEDITPEMCAYVMSRGGSYLPCIPKRFLTKQICENAVKRCPGVLRYVPWELQTQEMCDYAVLKNPYAYLHVPKYFRSSEMRNHAIQKVPEIANGFMVCEKHVDYTNQRHEMQSYEDYE